MRFSDHHEVIMMGDYPRIHDKLKAIINLDDIKGKVILDAGACTGSFGLWTLAKGATAAIINDARVEYIQRAQQYAQQHAKVNNFQAGQAVFDLNKVTEAWTCPLKIDTLIARRFIYELRDDEVRRHFVREINAKGCKVVYLQGLVRVKSHVEPLWNVELEAEAFLQEGYSVTHYNGNDLMRLERA